MIIFGQFVIGAPGSGKTTYCYAMYNLLGLLKRKCIIVNLDPANETVPYDCAVDIRELIRVEDVMTHLKLGPNGSMIYCLEYLEKNASWLTEKLSHYSDCYMLFDCPGQIELYVHNDSIRTLISYLTRLQDSAFRITAVNLVDSHHCTDAGKYISILLTSLSAMLHLALPHINVLSKIDVAEKFSSLSFGIDFYTDVLDLSYLVDKLKDDKFLSRYARLNDALVGLIQDYNIVSFYPLNVQDKELMARVLNACDKANGYSLSNDSESVASLLASSVDVEDKSSDFL